MLVSIRHKYVLLCFYVCLLYTVMFSSDTLITNSDTGCYRNITYFMYYYPCFRWFSHFLILINYTNLSVTR